LFLKKKEKEKERRKRTEIKRGGVILIILFIYFSFIILFMVLAHVIVTISQLAVCKESLPVSDFVRGEQGMAIRCPQ